MTVLVDFDELLLRCVQQRQSMPADQRLIVALAGAPGAGKSTLAERLVGSLNNQSIAGYKAAVVPMDGFHLDNGILEKRNQLSIKGSPGTFDVASFRDLLLRLRKPLQSANAGALDHDNIIYFPLFDRAMDMARMAADFVDDEVKIIVVEGNYLLLKRFPWHSLKSSFDLTVMLDVPEKELERRLIQRWIDHGLSDADAHRRALSNDIPNAKVVLSESMSADLRIDSVRQ